MLTSDWTQYERYRTNAMELETVTLRRLRFYFFLAYLLFYTTPARIVELIKKVNIIKLPVFLLKMLFQPKRKELPDTDSRPNKQV